MALLSKLSKGKLRQLHVNSIAKIRLSDKTCYHADLFAQVDVTDGQDIVRWKE